MYNYPLSLVAGFLALSCVAASYFCKHKTGYLLLQVIGIFFMVFSYLFVESYFSMVVLAVSLARTLTCFFYEQKEKQVPFYLACFFASAAVGAYFIVNVWILKTAIPLDILYLLAQVGYAFAFPIRNIRLMRYVMTIPHVFAILYNVLLGLTPFVALSYTLELAADIYAILRDHLQTKKGDAHSAPKQDLKK